MTKERIAEELARILAERPEVAVVLAEILGPPLALREMPPPPDPDEAQSR
ncbi:MAG: hypothetical protein GXO72_05115 [Caldiserica bacterium]|nr:hypothetical protein [Caldisericota bacterium]